MGRKRRAPDQERAELVERLAAVVVDLTQNLDHGAMLDRVARSAADLVEADGAAFLYLQGDHSTIV
ncbi:MAG: hypothetical protein QOJ09_3062, partial [Actinomycetota bacterium]|nr:hypothetical protein [Actinomycetota bacterium]